MLFDKLIACRNESDSIAITDTKRSYSYKALYTTARKTSHNLSCLGVSENDRIAIINNNSIETVITILACIKSHICFIILPEEISNEQVEYIMKDSQASLLIRDCNSVICDNDDTDDDCDMVLSTDNESELVYILYTSGSTGKPKGVAAPLRQVVFCIDAINRRLQNTAQDRILCVLPLSFDYGMYQMFLAFSVGGTLVLPQNALIQAIPRLLLNEEITCFPAMPAMLNMLVYTKMLNKVELPKLRYITSTGDVFPVALIRKLQVMLPQTCIVPMYGLTECKRVSIMPLGETEKILAGSCGLPLDGVSVSLINQDKDGIGELVVSGPNVMAGYWNDEKTTSQYYFYDKEKGNSLRTGDLFQIDDDGFLFYRGRIKRIIKVNGYRIGCSELENKLWSNLGCNVNNIRMIGIPDTLSGHKIVACIVSLALSEDVQSQVSNVVSKWPAYQKPYALYLTQNDFPKNRNGKIDERLLLEEIKTNGFFELY